jgi:NTP pyrophosphatase (non-canonical NTP hydrolase)
MGDGLMSFREEFERMQAAVHRNAVAHGWWEDSDNVRASLEDRPDDLATYHVNEMGAKLALIHSEVSEALEAVREGNPPSEKLSDDGLSLLEEELADVVIRCMDLAGRHGLRLAQAIEAKHVFNLGRSHRHGGKRL